MAAIKEWLIAISEPALVVIDALALIMFIAGTTEAFVRGMGAMLASPPWSSAPARPSAEARRRRIAFFAQKRSSEAMGSDIGLARKNAEGR